ncbi:MAG: hypothetical protein HYW24_02745 [Candidatus Aenigmarchaeota archaeon]|nr:hypothetical protein [Candidatus Aenigmarchaeota archaeon]
MRALLVGILSFLILVSPALALNITVSVDKYKVMMDENVTLSGTITFDNGSATKFEYRTAIVAPKRVIVCDSNRTMTASDGTFNLTCKIPTAEEANSLGIPAASTRSAIPYVAGVAVKDPVKNETVKKHARAVIAVNSEKLNRQFDRIITDIDNFVTQSRRFLPECDAVAENATRFNVTAVTTRCLEVQQKINDLILNSTELSNQARQLKDNISATSLEDFRNSLKTLADSQKDLRGELKDIKDTIKSVKWETLKEVRKSASEIKQDIEKKREEIKEMRKPSGGRR